MIYAQTFLSALIFSIELSRGLANFLPDQGLRAVHRRIPSSAEARRAVGDCVAPARFVEGEIERDIPIASTRRAQFPHASRRFDSACDQIC